MRPLDTKTQMFEHLWQHICRFLKLHRVDKTPTSMTFLNRDSASNSDSFFSALCDVPFDDRAQCHVRQLTWYKDSEKPSRHEFIAAELSNSACLLVGRTVPAGTKSFAIASTSSNSLDSFDKVKANDHVHVYASGRKDSTLVKVLAPKKVGIVCQYTFSDFPVLEFSRLVLAISLYSRQYVINNEMCYWYASLVMNLGAQLFQVSESRKSDARGGKWGPFTFTIDEKAANIIKENYIQARDADPMPAGPTVTRIVNAEEHAERSKQEAERSKQREERSKQEAERSKQEAERSKQEAAGLREKVADSDRRLESLELEFQRYKAIAEGREGH